MPTLTRKLGRKNRKDPGPLVTKQIMVTRETGERMKQHMAQGVNWSAQCELMIIAYMDLLERGSL